MMTLFAPMLVMMLGFVAGWIWFALWLVTWPARRMWPRRAQMGGG
jgi:hypothetical protein